MSDLGVYGLHEIGTKLDNTAGAIDRMWFAIEAQLEAITSAHFIYGVYLSSLRNMPFEGEQYIKEYTKHLQRLTYEKKEDKISYERLFNDDVCAICVDSSSLVSLKSFVILHLNPQPLQSLLCRPRWER
jgi:hypothetical protein